MICDNLITFADGELDVSAATEFRAHLGGCAPCQDRLVAALQLDAVLSTLSGPFGCDHHPEVDSTGAPCGKRCGAPATHLVAWMDATQRFSMACSSHLSLAPEAPNHAVIALPGRPR